MKFISGACGLLMPLSFSVKISQPYRSEGIGKTWHTLNKESKSLPWPHPVSKL
jgi:hypothetical protein